MLPQASNAAAEGWHTVGATFQVLAFFVLLWALAIV